MTYHHGNLRQTLLERAAHIIAAQGIDGLSLRALARDIGVSHSAPARHFKDKHALLAGLAAEAHEKLKNFISQAADDAGKDPVARYNAMGKATIRFALAQPAYFKALQNPEVHQRASPELKTAHGAYLDTVKEAADAAHRAGWNPREDTMTLFTFSTAAAHGAATLFSDMFGTNTFAHADLLALGEKVIDLVIPPHSSLCSTNGA
ncbi:MAG: TetR/AcrR family transcriptional regulator [Parvibaculum sp.]